MLFFFFTLSCSHIEATNTTITLAMPLCLSTISIERINDTHTDSLSHTCHSSRRQRMLHTFFLSLLFPSTLLLRLILPSTFLSQQKRNFVSVSHVNISSSCCHSQAYNSLGSVKLFTSHVSLDFTLSLFFLFFHSTSFLCMHLSLSFFIN